MRNRARYRIRGPVLVSAEQFKAAYDLIEGIRLLDPSSRTEGALNHGPSTIRVTMRDGQTFEGSDPDAVLKINNQRSNPINELSIRTGSFGTDTATLTLGGPWFGNSGVDLETSGDQDRNQSHIRRVQEIFDVERDILTQVLAAPRVIQIVVTLLIANFALGFLTGANGLALRTMLQAREYGGFLLYLMLFWLMPALPLYVVFDVVINRWFGNGQFAWGNGTARLERQRKILLFFLYTMPLAVITRLVVIFVLGK